MERVFLKYDNWEKFMMQIALTAAMESAIAEIAEVSGYHLHYLRFQFYKTDGREYPCTQKHKFRWWWVTGNRKNTRRGMKKIFSTVFLLFFFGLAAFMASCTSNPERILIFTKTNEIDGHRHESIEKGVEVLTSLSMDLGYEVEHSENDSLFNERNLSKSACW